MPFDGRLDQLMITTSPVTIQHKRFQRSWASRLRTALMPVAVYVMVGTITIMLLSVIGEITFPDRGPLTWLTTDTATVRQNIIAYQLWDNAQKLRFDVGYTHYMVATPDHTLTAEEQTAWLGFATRKKFPVYSVDGPMAVDP